MKNNMVKRAIRAICVIGIAGLIAIPGFYVKEEKLETNVVSENALEEKIQVEVEALEKGALKAGTSVVANDITKNIEGTMLETIAWMADLKPNNMVIKNLDISIVDENQKEIQPDGMVQVAVDVPENANPDTVSVYYLGNGFEEPTKIESNVENGKVYFNRDHFCQFCIIAESIPAGYDGSANLGWYVRNVNTDKFYISTGSDLRGLIRLFSSNTVYVEVETGKVVTSTSVNAQGQRVSPDNKIVNTAEKTNFEGKTIYLLNDITMSDTAFEGIGLSTNPFKGTFDGNGYTLKNFKSTRGLFYYNAGTILNLAFENADVTISSGNGAVIAANNNGKIYNCYVYGSTISSAASSTLGMIAGANNATSGYIENCYVLGSTFSATYATKGMILGSGYSAERCKNCYIDSSVGTTDSNFVTVDTDIISGSEEAGLTAILNANIELLPHDEEVEATDVYSAFKLESRRPKFENHLTDSYVEINAYVSINGAVDESKQFISFEVGAKESHLKSKMYNGYNGPVFYAQKSDANYTFKGWFDNPEGTGTAIEERLTFHVDEYAMRNYYAVYTGGPYIVNLVAQKEDGELYLGTVSANNTEGNEISVEVDRKSEISVHAAGIEGYAFAGWYKPGADTPLSTNRANNCEYKFVPTENTTLEARYIPGVTIKAGYVIGTSSYMGTIEATAFAVEAGQSSTLTAKPKSGYEFAGWYSDEAGTNSLDTSISLTIDVPVDYYGFSMEVYAKFKIAGQPYIDASGANGIVYARDPGNTVVEVFYQYAGSTEYMWIEDDFWQMFCRNGRGKDPNADYKADYSANIDAYSWNGTDGYKSLNKNITTTSIILEYSGWHNFLFKHKKGESVYYTHECFYLSPEMLGGEQSLPTISKKYNTAIFNSNNSATTQVLYQLTSTDVDAIACPVFYTDWYHFTATGKGKIKNDEGAMVNGDEVETFKYANGEDGFRQLEANKDGSFDKRNVTINTPGWYTFFVKYGGNLIRAIYVKITAEDINEGKGAKLTQHLNYSFDNKAFVGYEVTTRAIAGATSYGMIFKNKNTGAETYLAQYGYFRGRTYFVYNTNLVAGTKYDIYPAVLDGTTVSQCVLTSDGYEKVLSDGTVEKYRLVSGSMYKIIGASATITTADKTVKATYNSDYYASTSNGIGYKNTNYTSNGLGALDMMGAGGIRVTYSNAGWKLYNGESTSYNTFSSSDNVTIIPSESLIRGVSGTEYVQMKFTIRNNTASKVTNYRFAIAADTQIGSLDSAPIYRQEYGITMVNSSANQTLALIANSNSNVDGLIGKSTTASTVWFGAYSSNTYPNNRYVNQTSSSISGVDSAMAVSWQNITLEAGETKDYCIIMGVVGSGVLTVPATQPKVENTEDGNIKISANNTSASENLFTKVEYAYVSDNVDAAECPFKTTSSENLKHQGMNYKGVNGKNGVNTIEGSLIEDGDFQNNLVPYTEAGWYEFLLSYETRTYANPSDHSTYTSETKKIPMYVKISESDLFGTPIVKTSGNTFSVVPNGTTFKDIYYQLSSKDMTDLKSDLIYTGDNPQAEWTAFCKVGVKYSDSNGALGYKGKALKDDETKETFRRIVTTAGWYTIRIKYLDTEGNTHFLYKYKLFTDDDVNIEGPLLSKEYNVITIRDNDSGIKLVKYQLTVPTSEGQAPMSESEFKTRYAYGTGTYYTSIGESYYKTSNEESDENVFSIIGRYSSVANYRRGITSNVLEGENTTNGFKVKELKDGTGVRLGTAGWYTARIEYGDGYWITRYVYISEDDVRHEPLSELDKDTGILKISANGFTVTSAAVQYLAPYNNEEGIPISYRYDMEHNDTYIWNQYMEVGKSKTENEYNGSAGYKSIDIGKSEDAIGRTALYIPGWYAVWIKYGGGVILNYIPFTGKNTSGEDILAPTITQIVGTETINNDSDIVDNRLLLTYQDPMGESGYPLQSYAYGYIGADAPSYRITSWIKMSDLCGGDENIITYTKSINPDESGRHFNMVIPKNGYYAVMVKDYFYGTRYYVVHANKSVTPRTTRDENMPVLKVDAEKKLLTAAKESGSIVYMKESTDSEFTRDTKTKLISGGVKTIYTIDESGRLYEGRITVDNSIVDRDELKAQIDELTRLKNRTNSIADADFEACETPGRWTMATTFDKMVSMISTATTLYENPAATQTAIDKKVEDIIKLIAEYEKNTKLINRELVEAIGHTLRVNIPEDAHMQYIIYCVEERVTISTGIKPPKSTIWQDWAGVSSEFYRKLTKINDNTYVIENVPDGVYTFQIKMDDAIYFANPVVSEDAGNKIPVIKREMKNPADDEAGIIGEAETVIKGITKKSDKTVPYVPDWLYADFEKEIKKANKLYDEITDFDEARYKELIDEAAKLRKMTRQVKNAIVYSKDGSTTVVETVDAATGKYKAVNAEGKLITAYVSRGKHTNWTSFSSHAYEKISVEDADVGKAGSFAVNGDGVYTVYVKYNDGTYDYVTFEASGYTLFPLTVERVGAKLNVEIPVSYAGKVTKLAYLGNVAIKYDSDKFIDITDKIETESTPQGTKQSVICDVLAIKDHTFYAEIEGEKYYLTYSLGETPLLQLYDIDTDEDGLGAKIQALTAKGTVDWVAYAEGSYSSWDEMTDADNNEKVHYIAQNDITTITAWNTEDKEYTFYFKGTSGHYDYIITVSSVGIYSTSKVN